MGLSRAQFRLSLFAAQGFFCPRTSILLQQNAASQESRPSLGLDLGLLLSSSKSSRRSPCPLLFIIIISIIIVSLTLCLAGSAYSVLISVICSSYSPYNFPYLIHPSFISSLASGRFKVVKGRGCKRCIINTSSLDFYSAVFCSIQLVSPLITYIFQRMFWKSGPP